MPARAGVVARVPSLAETSPGFSVGALLLLDRSPLGTVGLVGSSADVVMAPPLLVDASLGWVI
jgi:hypothetical protein